MNGFGPEFMYDAGRSFTQGAFSNINPEGIGKAAGTIFEEGLKNSGTGAGKGFAEGLNNFFKNFKFAESANTFSDEFSDASENLGSGFSRGTNNFFKNFKFSDAAGTFGNEFKTATENMSEPMNEAFSDAAGTFLRNGLFNYLKYVVPTIILGVGIPLGLRYCYHKLIHAIGRPNLAIKERQVTILTPLTDKIKNFVSRIFNIFSKQSKTESPVFNEEITRKISEITRSIPNIVKNDGFFQNVLLYGPGGTGKTMISEKIAKDANVNYIMMSGGDLPQYIKRGEHVTELNKLFDKIASSSKPTILFIDEAESFAGDRGKLKRSELIELQNAFLNRTGTQSKKLMIIMATNRLEDLDQAVLSRMDYKIHIGPPALKERVAILKSYIPHFFSAADSKLSFSEEQIQRIALRIDNFSGRTIFKMLNAIACKKGMSVNNKLTSSDVNQTVTDFVVQEAQVASFSSK